MAVTTTKTNKPLNPRGNDQSPKGYNRAALYSGKALDFDGVNDKVTIDTDDVDLQEFSVVQYVNLGATAASKIFYSNYAPTGNVGFATGISDSTANVPKFYTKGTSSDTLFGSFALNAGEWYQIVATYDGATKKLYVNGVLDTEVAFSDTIVYTNATNQIGALSPSIAQPLDGQLSNVKVYSTALTAAQVADLYNNPEKIVPTGVSNDALKLWLPMQEGAGTTAYDGSGNGNHGTISGATYQHGIGAPVAQTAVIDWNKGTNLLTQTEAIADNWSLSGGTWSSGQDDPFGGTNAAKITATNTDPYAYRNANNGIGGTQYTAKVWVKGNASREARLWIIRDNIEFPYEDFTLTGDWQEIETTKTFGTTPVSFVTFRLDIPNDTPGVGDIAYIFAPRLVAGDNADVYAPTLSTSQTSEVLLPAGLTTGRDITGVNLFENVRKQGALNLDGNSWAEVHDNASIDLSDANASFEAWVYYDFTATSNNYIFNKLVTAGYRIRIEPGGNFGFYVSDGTNVFSDGGSFPLVADSWNHLVLTTDGTNFKRYINGSLADTDISGTPITSLSNADDLYIGSNQTPGDYMPSQIAQPRIYNRALTAEEVLQNYNSGKSIYQ